MGDLDFTVRVKTNYPDPKSLTAALGRTVAHGCFRIPTRLPAGRSFVLVLTTIRGTTAVKGTAEVVAPEADATWVRFLSASDSRRDADLVLHDVEVTLPQEAVTKSIRASRRERAGEEAAMDSAAHAVPRQLGGDVETSPMAAAQRAALLAEARSEEKAEPMPLAAPIAAREPTAHGTGKSAAIDPGVRPGTAPSSAAAPRAPMVTTTSKRTALPPTSATRSAQLPALAPVSSPASRTGKSAATQRTITAQAAAHQASDEAAPLPPTPRAPLVSPRAETRPESESDLEPADAPGREAELEGGTEGVAQGVVNGVVDSGDSAPHDRGLAVAPEARPEQRAGSSSGAHGKARARKAPPPWIERSMSALPTTPPPYASDVTPNGTRDAAAPPRSQRSAQHHVYPGMVPPAPSPSLLSSISGPHPAAAPSGAASSSAAGATRAPGRASNPAHPHVAHVGHGGLTSARSRTPSRQPEPRPRGVQSMPALSIDQAEPQGLSPPLLGLVPPTPGMSPSAMTAHAPPLSVVPMSSNTAPLPQAPTSAAPPVGVASQSGPLPLPPPASSSVPSGASAAAAPRPAPRAARPPSPRPAAPRPSSSRPPSAPGTREGGPLPLESVVPWWSTNASAGGAQPAEVNSGEGAPQNEIDQDPSQPLRTVSYARAATVKVENTGNGEVLISMAPPPREGSGLSRLVPGGDALDCAGAVELGEHLEPEYGPGVGAAFEDKRAAADPGSGLHRLAAGAGAPSGTAERSATTMSVHPIARPLPWLWIGIACACTALAAIVIWWALGQRGGEAATPAASTPPAAAKPPPPAPAAPAASPAAAAAAAASASAPAAADAGAPSPAVPPAAGVPALAADAAPPDATCQLRVSSNADRAEVFIAGKSLGQTPAKLDVPCRPLTVELRHSRYATISRDVDPSSDAAVEIKMSRPIVTVIITSQPPGATVRVNGREVGKTPLSTDVPAFQHATILWSASSGAFKTQQIYPQAEGDRFSATLPGH